MANWLDVAYGQVSKLVEQIQGDIKGPAYEEQKSLQLVDKKDICTKKESDEKESTQDTFCDRIRIGVVQYSSVYIDGLNGNIVIKPNSEVPRSSVQLHGASGNTVRLGFGAFLSDEKKSSKENLLDRVKVGAISEGSSLHINGCAGHIIQIGDVTKSKVCVNACEGSVVQIGRVIESSVDVKSCDGNIVIKQASDASYSTDATQDYQGSVMDVSDANVSFSDEDQTDSFMDISDSYAVVSKRDAKPGPYDDSSPETQPPGKDHKASCAHCKRAEKKYATEYVSPKVLLVHMTDFRRKASERSARKNILQNLEKKVCALRNTFGGVILVHLSEQAPGDRYLGHFDEFISSIFPTVAEYGEMATDAYRRTWLFNVDGFESFQNFVLLSVTKSPWLVTVDFNTKIRNDFETAKPSHLCIVSLLSKQEQKDDTTRQTVVSTRGSFSDPQNLHECRNIELKAFRPKQNVLETIVKDAKKLSHYIWQDLKLKDSLTSMSKVKDGGSYFVGISERNKKHPTYETVVPEISGFKVEVPEEDFLQELKEHAHANLSVLHRNGKVGEAPGDLFDLKLHMITSDKYVLEVVIRYFDGIVFSDRNGPRSYKISNGKIVRMEFEEWMWKIHVTKSHFKS